MRKTTIIDTDKRKKLIDVAEILDYRDLLLTLAWRDYRVKYAQTFLGLLWALLQPLFTLLIFIFVFGIALDIDTGSVPYPLFAVAGMSAWTYFSYVVTQAGSSLIGAQNMIKKIFFPRIIIPLSKAFVGLVDYGIVLLMLFGLMLFYGYIPSGNIIYLPIFILAAIITAVGIGIWISALTIRYRDFQHVIPFIVQLGLYITPVAFPSEIILSRVPDWAAYIYFANPMAGICEGIRWSLFNTTSGLEEHVFYSFGISIILFFTGIIYFRKAEKTVADIL